MSAQVCLTLQTLLSHSLGLKLPKIFVLGATKNIYHSSSARDICNTSKTRDMYYLPGLGKKYMYVYEICLREQKQIGISYLAFSSLRVDSQIVWWKCMESMCYTLCTTCSVLVCLKLSYNQT